MLRGRGWGDVEVFMVEAEVTQGSRVAVTKQYCVSSCDEGTGVGVHGNGVILACWGRLVLITTPAAAGIGRMS